jgi:hypothetical protein
MTGAPNAEARNGRNPYVFIVGCPRSGTTMLRRMVDAHPAVASTPETHWIPRYFEQRLDVTPAGMVTRRLATRLVNNRHFPELQIEPDAIEELLALEPPLSYASFVSRLFDLYGEQHAKLLVGDKTPRYVRHIETLHELWPQAKFVHLIRDGRDVCLSMMNWPRADRAAGRFRTWRDDPVSTSALFWEWNVHLGRRAGAALGPQRYYEVRYETVVDRPAAACDRLCGFLAVPFSDRMVRYHERHSESAGSEERTSLPPTPGLRDWRYQLPAEAIERFEAVAGDLLSKLGYTRRFPNPSAKRLAEAGRLRSRFNDELEATARARWHDRPTESSADA